MSLIFHNFKLVLGNFIIKGLVWLKQTKRKMKNLLHFGTN